MAAPSRKTMPSGGFLPRGTVDFLRRRLTQVGGLLMLALGGAGLAALVTADPHDPSFNTAASGPVINALGRPGAWFADFLFQAVGWGGAVLALTWVVWGLLVVVRVRLPGRWMLRLMILPLTMVLWGLALAALPLPDMASLPAGPGGALGLLLVKGLGLLLPPEFAWIAGPAAALVGLAASVFVLGLTGAEWAGLGRRSLDMANAAPVRRLPPCALIPSPSPSRASAGSIRCCVRFRRGPSRSPRRCRPMTRTTTIPSCRRPLRIPPMSRRGRPAPWSSPSARR